MSANTKYSPAPQRDSFDNTGSYSQAPPAYIDEPTSSTDQAALLGGPRSSEDNVPDDFKVCGSWEGKGAFLTEFVVWRRGL